MRVKMTKTRSRVVDSTNTKTWPEGWVGEVADEIVTEWLKESPPPCEIQEPVPVALRPGEQFTDDQKLVLQMAANQIIEAANAQSGSDNTAEGEIKLEELTMDELREVAKLAGIPDAGKNRKKVDLVAALRAKQESGATAKTD